MAEISLAEVSRILQLGVLCAIIRILQFGGFNGMLLLVKVIFYGHENLSALEMGKYLKK